MARSGSETHGETRVWSDIQRDRGNASSFAVACGDEGDNLKGGVKEVQYMSLGRQSMKI